MKKKKILLLANSFWYLYKFRGNLMKKLECDGFDVVACAPRGDPFQARIPFRTVIFRLNRKSVNPFFEFVSLIQILTTLLRERPDIMLTFTPKANLYGGLCARLTNIRYLANISGVGRSFSNQWAIRKVLITFYRICLKGARHVFFQNNQDLDYFINNRVVKGSHSRIYGSGVDLEHFSAKGKIANNGRRVFLLAARLIPEKGVADYIEAARIIVAKHRSAKFLCCGPFEDTTIKSTVERAVSDGVIEYLGFLDEMQGVIEGSEALVLPTYYNEGIPRILIEGIAMGRAIVTTKQAGCMDVVREGKNGFFVPPQDPETLARIMESLIEMPDARLAEMGEVSAMHARELFDENHIIEEYLARINI